MREIVAMIGVYDSGLGGMLLARMIGQRLPDHQIIGYLNTSGHRLDAEPEEKLINRWHDGQQYLRDHGATIILIACHQISSLGKDVLASERGPAPVGIVEIAARMAIAASKHGRIGVLADRTVLGIGMYLKLIEPAAQAVIAKACPLLVPLLEEGWYRRTETKMIIKHYLRPLKQQQVDTIIPAGSHYQFILPLIAARSGKHTQVVDPFAGLVAVAASLVSSHYKPEPDGNPIRYRLHCTNLTEFAERSVATIFGRHSGCWEFL